MGKYWGSVQLSPLVPGRTLDKAHILHTAPDVHETWGFFPWFFCLLEVWEKGNWSSRSLLCLSRVPAALERLKLRVVAFVFLQLAFRLWGMTGKTCTGHTNFRFSFSYTGNQKGPLLRNRQYRNIFDFLPRLSELAKWWISHIVQSL